MERKEFSTLLYNVAEVELTYKTKVKASLRLQINSSDDAYNLFKQAWEEGKIELVEQFKVLAQPEQQGVGPGQCFFGWCKRHGGRS